jgi:hypothetical protein
MRKSIIVSALVFFAVLEGDGCSKKSTPPLPPVSEAPRPALEPPASLPAPTPTTASAPASLPGNYEGAWTGNSGEDLPLSFTVQNNQVSPVNVSLKGKKGSCNLFSSFPSEASVPLKGNAFTAHGKKDQFEFTLNGTFNSPTDATGTIDWKGNMDICGSMEMQFKWTAKKGPAEMPED